jgi:hypothetical protein
MAGYFEILIQNFQIFLKKKSYTPRISRRCPTLVYLLRKTLWMSQNLLNLKSFDPIIARNTASLKDNSREHLEGEIMEWKPATFLTNHQTPKYNIQTISLPFNLYYMNLLHTMGKSTRLMC